MKTRPAITPGEFMTLLMNGFVRPEEIHDWIEVWHSSPDTSTTLAQFLGMNETEYKQWVVQEWTLPGILAYRKAVLLYTEDLPPDYAGAWWKKGDVYRPDPRTDKELRLNFFYRIWLWLCGWRSAHWCIPFDKWLARNEK